MPPATIISRTDLARRTRQVMDQARHGRIFVVESYGEEQVAILDILDYHLLCAVAAYRTSADSQQTTLPEVGLTDEAVQQAVTQAGGNAQAAWNRVMAAYWEGHISLGRAAQLLNLSRFDLLERLHRLGLPLNAGPTSADEARAEVEALQA